MKIGWDSDGVLYNFTKAYHTWMNVSRGMTIDVDSQPATWNWFLEWQTIEQFKICMDEAVDAGQLFWQGELYEPEIPAIIAQLKAEGHENHLITHRFSGVTSCSKLATAHFYAENGVKFDSITYSKDKTVVKVDVFIEDNLDNYDALEAAGVESWLINRPYNLRKDNRRRVNSVKEFAEMFLT